MRCSLLYKNIGLTSWLSAYALILNIWRNLEKRWRKIFSTILPEIGLCVVTQMIERQILLGFVLSRKNTLYSLFQFPPAALYEVVFVFSFLREALFTEVSRVIVWSAHYWWLFFPCLDFSTMYNSLENCNLLLINIFLDFEATVPLPVIHQCCLRPNRYMWSLSIFMSSSLFLAVALRTENQ